MKYGFNDIQVTVRENVLDICSRFDLEYWYKRDINGKFPEDFYKAIADAGYLGIAMPEEFGGSGLGITEAALLMQAVTESGGGLTAASSIHMNIFGLHPVVVYGTDEQKRRMLPPLIRGEEKACFGVTEPAAGLNTARTRTKAERKGDKYVVNGQKVWISTAQEADRILLLARTTPLEECKRPTDGLSVFYTKLDRGYVQVREIEKMGRKAVDSNELFIEDLPVPVEDLVGVEGKGFHTILSGMNAERILIAAECVGIGRAALNLAAKYARERIVFDRPIGQNQAIQHPLARCWADLEAANLMTFYAASLHDAGEPCGTEANAAKLLAAEAGFKTCERAVLTHGGFGYAREYHVERLFREIMLPRIAPVSAELILCNIAEKKLGLPKSY
jgi:acyl-CoA dehydrogenase